ncbi:MAG: peptidylprolyl isomerase [Candidatus Pacearchaeota archaeon]
MIKENDFIEIDFVGRVKGGDVFDSTKKEDLEKLHSGHNHPIKSKPLIFCVGKGMFLESLDKFLLGKEVGKKYEVDLTPEKAFGKRDISKIQRIPSKVFMEQKVNPVPGAVFNFDGRVGKILTSSGGRVVVDFNHSLAGKDVSYKINVLRKVTDMDEKVSAVNDFFLKKEFKFKVDEKGKKLIIEADDSMGRLIELFKDKYKDILGLDVEVKNPDKEKSKPKNDEDKNSKELEKSNKKEPAKENQK